MKKRVQSLCFAGALVLFLSIGLSLSAQQTPQNQPPDPQAQQPTADQAAPPAQQQAPTPQTPDQASQPAQSAPSQATPASDVQSFTGTIVKSGDKYVFQDEASGNTYDIDHQDEVQKFEGKKVKVHGKLDASGKLIRLQ